MQTTEKSPEFSNSLVGSTSLYLRQHAHNPVAWMPWSHEAINTAKKLDRPILLSSGYSSCYWCHVMEREVFENVSIASYMNEHFICIKLDREEHPLVDETYMIARQLITREGGWPNNVFLTPDLKPFYACGTHGAKDTNERPSFIRLLEWVNAQWQTQRKEMNTQADEVHRLTQNLLKLRENKDLKDLSLASITHSLTDQLLGAHDDISGGFHKAPKFPHETYISYLLHVGQLLDFKPAVDVAIDSLMKMAAGGIYDHVGCGFHRYAIDKDWYVPHFEKMLYNQALCASAYTQASVLTNNPFLEDIARGTLESTSATLTSEYGPFYSSIDAETQGVEGAYYCWEASEILEVLDEAESNFFMHYFALVDIPHFPGHKKPTGQTIVMRNGPLWYTAQAENLPYVQIASMSGQILNKLLNHRNQRLAPNLDEKIITSWNGLMIKAYAEGFAKFKNKNYADCAIKAASYFYGRSQERGGLLHHTYYKTRPTADPILEDYAYLAAGVLEIARSTDDTSVNWLEYGRQLLKRAQTMFYQEETNSYLLNNPETTLGDISLAHATDSNLPSPIGVIFNANLTLYELTNGADILEHFIQLKETYQPTIQIHGMLEYCELVTALNRLAKIQGDEQFEVTAKKLLYTNAETHHTVQFIANLAPNSFVEDDKPLDIHIKISIQDGWYIDDFRSPDGTSKLLISGHNIKSIEQLELPEATPVAGADEEKAGHQGILEIKATVMCQRAKDRQPIEIQFNYQPCDSKQCYQPQQKRHLL